MIPGQMETICWTWNYIYAVYCNNSHIATPPKSQCCLVKHDGFHRSNQTCKERIRRAPGTWVPKVSLQYFSLNGIGLEVRPLNCIISPD